MNKYYSDHKIFLFPENVKSALDGRHSAPLHVRLKPTNKCNHSCWFCAYRADGLSLGDGMQIRDEIPWDVMCDLISDFIEMGIRAVTFSGGGEPLLYPRIGEVVDRLHEAGIKTAFITNGTYLKGELADTVAKKSSWVRVSLDGWDGESHAKSRKVKPSDFDNICNNIENFCKKNGRAVLSINYVVTQSNAHTIYEFCKTMKNIGVANVKISACVVSDSREDNVRHHAGIQEMVSGQIEMVQRELLSSSFSITDHYHIMESVFNKNYSKCYYMSQLTVVGADCNVYTCHDKAYTASGLLGSFARLGFKNFWFSGEVQKKIETLNPSKDCLHHCRENQKNIILNSLSGLENDHLEFI